MIIMKLTTHILDVSLGRPAAGIRFELWRDGAILLSTVANSDGRSDSPLLEGSSLVPGPYELHFHVGEYFEARGIASPFLNVVPVWFRVENGKNYHVPLVVSPWAYSTYRGS